MSRTTLCLATAAGLATASCALMIARYHVLGEEVKVPLGPGTWKVTLVVHGRIVGGEARLITGMPLDFGRQHIWKEACRSNEFLPKPPDAKHPERHQVLWTERPAVAEGPFRAVCRCRAWRRRSLPRRSRARACKPSRGWKAIIPTSRRSPAT
ncbi:MAG: hypothetical protein E6K70_17505 [Planctomycetota bacterium]|nr:MAG: hypothetical protein E6K70_17505 [Planctomycetota bacterium]